VTYLSDMEKEPYRFDLLDVMRRIERTLGRPQGDLRSLFEEFTSVQVRDLAARPRIGDSTARRDETIVVNGVEYLVSFGQEPYLDFPASTIARVDVERDSTRKRIRIYSKFLGLLGPQGGLPYGYTEEAWAYMLQNDDAFPRFLDLFNQRFLQLFFRAWADSRPIVHADRPDFDRFSSYVLSTIGVGSPAFKEVEAIPDGIGVYAGLLGPKVKSASRLRFAVQALFGVDAQIDQFIGTWLQFDESERSLLGARNSGLGTDLLVGIASFDVQSKFRIRIFVADLDVYAQFLPEATNCNRLVDLVYFYLGDQLEWDVELALPASKVKPVVLGESGALGWTTWMSPNYPAHEFRRDARFNPAERVARRRRQSP
jgi:type VI secretion system protein ImpH